MIHHRGAGDTEIGFLVPKAFGTKNTLSGNLEGDMK
jgi:hypothetical protein